VYSLCGLYIGHLLLWTVTSALVAPSASSDDVVYEAKFVNADYFRGFSSNAIYLRLSTRYANHDFRYKKQWDNS